MSSTAPLRLEVLRDDPLFGSVPYDAGSDTFAYEAFAKALLVVLEANAPPLSIGLFGPWGIGKSTIVNILFSKIRAQSDSRLFPIYFNSWKYAGDSFRRQFLLEVASAVYGSQTHKQVQRLERLNYTDVLTQRPDTSWLAELKETLTGKNIRTRRSGVIRLILALFLVGMGAVFSLLNASVYPVIPATLAAIIVLVLKMKFEDVFVIEENRVYDPKLIFPEQFEAEFKALIAPELLHHKRALIVIDDIDRCDAATIKDILISTKSFVGQSNAYFIIPCDDLNVVNIFDDAAHKSGYRDEMLRQYFNIGLRVPPISNRDLIDFANRMARDTKLPEDIVQLAVIADYRDARRIKHFANNFLLKLQIAKTRSLSGLLPPWTQDRELQLAKLVIIEDCAPVIFSRLVQNPSLLQLLEASALSPEGDRKQLSDQGLKEWDTEYPGLKKALIGARYVSISDLEVLLSLKADNLELSVPSGAQFRAALLQGGPQETLTGLLPEIAGRSAQQALSDLIDDSLKRATGPLLANCIASTLSLPLKSFFTPNEAKRLARQIRLALLREEQRIWVQSGPAIVDMLELLDPPFAQEILNKFVTELKVLKELPPRAVETVNAIYLKIEAKAELIDVLNDRFHSWSASEAGLIATSALSLKRLSSGTSLFPSKALVESLVNAFNPLSTEVKSTELQNDVIFANWSPEYGPKLSRTFWAVIQNENSQGTFNQPLRLTLKALYDKPQILNSNNPEGDQIAIQLPGVLGRARTDEDRNLVRDCLIAVAIEGSQGSKATILNNLSSYWVSDSDERLRRDLKVAQSFSANNNVAVRLIDDQANAFKGEIQNPTERTRARVKFIEDFAGLFPPNFLNEQLIASLATGADAGFAFWEPIITSRRDQFSPQSAGELIKKALELVGTPGSLNARKPALLKRAIEFFTTQTPVEQSEFTRRVLLDMLWHQDETIRNSAAQAVSTLRAHANQGDFRIHLNAGIHEHLHRVGLSTFQQYQSVIDALVSNKDLWNAASMRSMTQLAVILSTSDALRAQALALLESVAEFHKDEVPDITHVLTTMASAQPSLGDRARTLIQRIAPTPDSAVGEVRTHTAN
jgi:hypothetical protein